METQQHEDVKTAIESAYSDLAQTEWTDKWMQAVWGIVDGKVVLRRTTWNFPKADLHAALRLLKEQIDRELAIPEITPLPLASHLRPHIPDGDTEDLATHLGGRSVDLGNGSVPTESVGHGDVDVCQHSNMIHYSVGDQSFSECEDCGYKANTTNDWW